MSGDVFVVARDQLRKNLLALSGEYAGRGYGKDLESFAAEISKCKSFDDVEDVYIKLLISVEMNERLSKFLRVNFVDFAQKFNPPVKPDNPFNESLTDYFKDSIILLDPEFKKEVATILSVIDKANKEGNPVDQEGLLKKLKTEDTPKKAEFFKELIAQAVSNPDVAKELKTKPLSEIFTSPPQDQMYKEAKIEREEKEKARLVNLKDRLGPQGLAQLYEGTSPVESTTARTRFLNYYHKRMEELKSEGGFEQNADKTVSLENFLGKEGFKLYKQAIREENRSKAFREAVFLKATKHYDGPKLDQPIDLVITGASSTGKTYGTEKLVEQILAEKTKGKTGNEGNDVVSIDGGIERELSQIRQIALEGALQVGYKGIQDLHKHSKLNVKKQVKNAVQNAEQKDTFSVAIPETCVSRRSLKAILPNFNPATTIVAYVHADKTQTEISGNRRAWRSLKDGLYKKLGFNRNDMGCESKEYEGLWFQLGAKLSRMVLGEAKEAGCQTFVINNEIVFVKPDERNACRWAVCTEDSPDAIRLNRVDFDWWKSAGSSYWQDNPLREWLANPDKPKGGLIITKMETTSVKATLEDGISRAREKMHAHRNKEEKGVSETQAITSEIKPDSTVRSVSETPSSNPPPPKGLMDKINQEKKRKQSLAQESLPSWRKSKELKENKGKRSESVARHRGENADLDTGIPLPPLPKTPRTSDTNPPSLVESQEISPDIDTIFEEPSRTFIPKREHSQSKSGGDAYQKEVQLSSGGPTSTPPSNEKPKSSSGGEFTPLSQVYQARSVQSELAKKGRDDSPSPPPLPPRPTHKT